MSRQLKIPMLGVAPEAPAKKSRKRSVSQILREAYALHCRDSATRHALRIHLKD